MNKNKIAEQLSGILPNRPPSPGFGVPNQKELVNQEAKNIQTKKDAKELARIKYLERQKLQRQQAKIEQRQALAEELGLDEIPDGQTEFQAKKLQEQKKRVEAIETLEAETLSPLSPTELAKAGGKETYTSNITRAMQLHGATRPEIVKLLTSLNININIQLSKQDTANILASLLTCNEAQLMALYNNKKVPIAIKAVIKRLQEDTRIGNIETVEKLWDRIFGKGPMQLNLPEQTQLQTGIIPDTPVSREAYILIRDTLIK